MKQIEVTIKLSVEYDGTKEEAIEFYKDIVTYFDGPHRITKQINIKAEEK